MRTILVQKSSNQKTGPIPVSISDSSTCPAACPLRGKGCYGATGPLAWVWRKVKGSWESFLAAVAALPEGTFWRHNQVGDLPGRGNRINAAALGQLVQANQGKRGFTYTHKPVLDGQAAGSTVQRNRQAVAEANRQGFTVNLSADNLPEADQLAQLAIAPVVTILPSNLRENTVTPDGRKVIICPAVTRGVQCKDCRLCQWAGRKVIIGFPAHGSQKRAVSAMATA